MKIFRLTLLFVLFALFCNTSKAQETYNVSLFIEKCQPSQGAKIAKVEKKMNFTFSTGESKMQEFKVGGKKLSIKFIAGGDKKGSATLKYQVFIDNKGKWEQVYESLTVPITINRDYNINVVREDDNDKQEFYLKGNFTFK